MADYLIKATVLKTSKVLTINTGLRQQAVRYMRLLLSRLDIAKVTVTTGGRTYTEANMRELP